MFNQINLLGRIGQIERKTDRIVEASLATSERFRDRETGETREDTQWHTLKFFNRVGEIAENFVHKGDLLMVTGKMTYRKYTTASGENRTVPEVIVDQFKLMPKQKADEAPQEPKFKPNAKPRPVEPEETDLPF